MNHHTLMLLICLAVAGVLVAMPRLRKLLLIAMAVAVVALVGVPLVMHHMAATGGAR